MKKILLIDDNPMNNNGYIQPLKQKYDVVVVMSIIAAKRKLCFHKFDLIIIDIMMPTPGVQCTDELSTGLYFYSEEIQPKFPKTPVLFWSNLNHEKYDNYFNRQSPSNVNFLHKNYENEKHLLEKVTEIFA